LFGSSNSDFAISFSLDAWISMLLAVVYFVIFLVWFIVYQTNWYKWGIAGENISLLVPRGDIGL